MIADKKGHSRPIGRIENVVVDTQHRAEETTTGSRRDALTSRVRARLLAPSRDSILCYSSVVALRYVHQLRRPAFGRLLKPTIRSHHDNATQ